MKPRHPVYRPGDVVRVIEPLVVRRVGYPLGLADGIKHIEEKHGGAVAALLDEIGIEHNRPASIEAAVIVSHGAAFESIVRELAYRWIRSEGFGGSERTIHTDLIEELRGVEFRVESRRIVKTGTYNRGGTRYCYDGIPDIDPPYLGDEQSHVLLTLASRYSLIPSSSREETEEPDLVALVGDYQFEIEVRHVTKTYDIKTGWHEAPTHEAPAPW